MVSGVLFCFGFYPWKRPHVRRFLDGQGRRVEFVWTVRAARHRGFGANDGVVVWGCEEKPAITRLAQAHGAPLFRLEDGFLRSVGLGSDFHAPASLVLDGRGIHYDPSRASDLEVLLQEGAFEAEELARARALSTTIVSRGISKYNVGDCTASLPRAPSGRPLVLVPGQVEDDASIRLGCVDVRTNEGLLRAVRERRPEAFVVFKPHPDVVSGNRRGAVADEVARSYADAVVTDAPLPACLASADEVHTMTSLVGFEALLRGKRVATYGLPFYAGWGLTDDRHKLARRTRKLALDELVAGCLLRYPLYLHPETNERTTPEAVVDALHQAVQRAGNQPLRAHFLVHKARRLLNAARATLSESFDRR